MPGYRMPGPVCQEEKNASYIDEGTMCLTSTPPPSSIGLCLDPVDEAIHVFEVKGFNFAIRFIQDSAVRLQYIRRIGEYSQSLRNSLSVGEISAQEAAEQANAMRNQLLEASRVRSSDIGKAAAEKLKAKGLGLGRLQEHYAQKLFKKSFEKLTKAEAERVFLAIVESSGRASPKVSSRVATLGRLGRGLLVVTVAISVYRVATSEDKMEAAGREGAGLGGGILGGAAGGAVAGLACGPGAPVCVTIGVFVGGVLGALGGDYAYDWLGN